MAYPNDRYWYVAGNGNGNWNQNQGPWYYGTGGTLGTAPIPTSTNDVYFDANSGSGTCTVNLTRTCRNLIMTGYTGTLNGNAGANPAIIQIYGPTITLSASGVFAPSNNPALHIYSGTTTTLTTNGQTVGDISIIITNSVLSLADDLIGKNNALLTLQQGTFQTNNKNVTFGAFTDNNVMANKYLYMGSGTWTLGATGPVDQPETIWNIQQPTYITIYPSTSTLKFLRFLQSAGLSTAITTTGSISTIDIRDSATRYSGGNISDWPSAGTVLIGEEQFTYTGKTGTAPTQLTGVTRAANGSGASTYPVGTAVLLLTPFRATLTTAFGTGDTQLNISDMSITGGSHGFLLVDDEIISYTSRSASTGAGYVSGLTRGSSYSSYGSSATVAHSSGVYVRPVEASIFTGGGLTYGTLKLSSAGNYQFLTSTANFTNISSYGSVGYRIRYTNPSNAITYWPAPSATITSTPTSINEGSSGTIGATLYGVLAGSTAYWDIPTNAGDFSTSSGTFVTNSTSGYNYIDGSPGTISVTPTADLTTEGSETFTVRVRAESGGTVLATTSSITINDTSITPVPTATLSGYTTTMLEGYTTNQFTVTTTNFANGTTLYYNIIKVSSGSLVGQVSYYLARNRSSGIVTDYILRAGNVTVNNGTASFNLISTNFNYNGNTEQFKVVLRRYPVLPEGQYMSFTNVILTAGNMNYNTSFITVVDPAIYFPVNTQIEFYRSGGGGGGLIRGTITSFSGPSNGYYTVNMTITYSAAQYSGAMSAYIAYRYNDQLDITSTISITDTAITYSRSPDTIYLNEGQTQTYTVTTTNLPTGLTCYWRIDPYYLGFGDTGNVSYGPGVYGYGSTADWAAVSGSFVTNGSGVGTFSITPLDDLITESSYEYSPVQIFMGTDVGTFEGSVIAHSGISTYVTDTSSAPDEFLPFFL